MLIRRLIPKSIARQTASTATKKAHKSNAKFTDVIINGSLKKINIRCLPDDLPSESDWFRIRIWQDEIEGRSLTL